MAVVVGEKKTRGTKGVSMKRPGGLRKEKRGKGRRYSAVPKIKKRGGRKDNITPWGGEGGKNIGPWQILGDRRGGREEKERGVGTP